jgi:hypothetical protein
MSTDLATLRSSAATIVIGTAHYDPVTGYRIDVDTTIKGTAKPGLPILVTSARNESIAVPDGTRLVALIDSSNQFRWAAEKVAGTTIENGVLRLHGFFDFNAHIVNPSIVTLAQLKTAITTGALVQTYDVGIAFFDGHGGTKVSAKHFSLLYDAITAKGTAVGFTGACLDLTYSWGFDWGDPELVFDDTCPKKSGNGPSRSMHLRGKPTGVDAAGNIQLEIVPNNPQMSEVEYDTFVADSSIAKFVSILDVKLADGTVWKWKVDEGLVDPTGKEHAVGGWSSSFEQKGSVSVSKETQDFGGIQIALTQNGNSRPLVEAIDAGVITSCTLIRKSPAPCTITHVASVVVHK